MLEAHLARLRLHPNTRAHLLHGGRHDEEAVRQLQFVRYSRELLLIRRQAINGHIRDITAMLVLHARVDGRADRLVDVIAEYSLRKF